VCVLELLFPRAEKRPIQFKLFCTQLLQVATPGAGLQVLTSHNHLVSEKIPKKAYQLYKFGPRWI
jgi:hypothetical protein